MRTEIITVLQEENGSSAGDVLKRRGYSVGLIRRIKRTENGLLVNRVPCRTVDTVHAGDTIRAEIPEKTGGARPCPSLFAAAVYEDEDIIVYDKPPGMPVHTSAGHYNDTLANYFAVSCPDIPFRPVNRLDRDTSGLCICAKNPRAANFPEGSIQKVYYAVCCGVIDNAMIIDAPIGREDNSVIKRTVTENGKRAVTEVFPVKNNGKYTLLRMLLHTGRTHQIRVHLSYKGFPLAGDSLYGGSCEDIGRQALHCGDMCFVHPVTGKSVNVKSELPEDIVQVIQ